MNGGPADEMRDAREDPPRQENGKLDRLHYRVPAAVDRLVSLRHSLDGWAQRAGLLDEDREALVLASYEAMANAVEHAYPGRDGILDLRANHEPHGWLTVTVTDYGAWKPPPTNPWPRGRGLPLINNLAVRSKVVPTADGTTVSMSWHAPAVIPEVASPLDAV